VLFDPLELVEKVVALIPPPRANLLRYHGVFAPNSKGCPPGIKYKADK